MRVLLINTNRVHPPIAPIGLEYVAEATHAAGHEVEILDLCWVGDWRTELERELRSVNYDVVGLTLRNTDDCAMASGQSFLPEFAEIVEEIRARTEAPVVLGGVGFSCMPEEILRFTGARLGVWAEGELAFPLLLDALERDKPLTGVPNLLYDEDGRVVRSPVRFLDPSLLPRMSRTWVQLQRYFREGAQVGFETKRGCDRRCIYCADPVAKGRTVRLRPPEHVADELEALLAQGIDHLHTCDSEFNLDLEHAKAVCLEIIRRGIGERIRWYAYCCPRPFPRALADLMRRAGCVGINFGVDSGDHEMLRRLGRDHTPEDILEVATRCREAGIATMFDLLIGGPGETLMSVRRTIELMKRAEPDCVGVAVGVRVYPGTPLQRQLQLLGRRQGIVVGSEPLAPIFYLEPEIAAEGFALLDSMIGDDPRFFFFDPERPRRNYNYNQNEALQEAIRSGYRGAYWDILRRWISSSNGRESIRIRGR